MSVSFNSTLSRFRPCLSVHLQLMSIPWAMTFIPSDRDSATFETMVRFIIPPIAGGAKLGVFGQPSDDGDVRFAETHSFSFRDWSAWSMRRMDSTSTPL